MGNTQLKSWKKCSFSIGYSPSLFILTYFYILLCINKGLRIILKNSKEGIRINKDNKDLG